jgi:hypothetical protein
MSGHRADLDALSGPDWYKARFGGQVFRYPSPVELIPSPIVRVSYDLGRRSAVGRKLIAWTKMRSRASGAAGALSVGRGAQPDPISGESE